MTDEEIIEMAKEAKLPHYWETGDIVCFDEVRHFAKLVEDKVTARYMQLFLDPENQPTQFGTATQEYREKEIKNEREACAKEADKRLYDYTMLTSNPPQNGAAWSIANAIRARGQRTPEGSEA